MSKYKVGSKVKVSPENDNESYDKFRNKVLIVTHVATNEKQHPGFDSGMKGEALYDFEDEAGEEIPCSLYDYEIVKA